MIGWLIDASAKNRALVLFAAIALAVAGVTAMRNIKLDAIPDLSDPQVIVFTEWMGRSPTLVEDQVTYPLVTSLLGAPHVVDVRGQTMFGMSFVYVVFEEGTDLYWARSRVLEYLNTVRSRLPPDANTRIGPDATGIGWVDVCSDQSCRINQQPGGHAFIQTMPLELACRIANFHQLGSGVCIDFGLCRHDSCLQLGTWVIKIKSHKALLGRLLQVLHQALIARVV